MRFLRPLGWSFLAVTLSMACGDGDAPSGVVPSDDAGVDAPQPLEPFRATVRRTTGGIPHVKADDLGGLGYGFGYAFAEDNVCVLAEEIMTVRGERAKHFGDIGYDGGINSARSNVASDAVFRMLATKEIADKSRATLDPDLQANVRGFAAGVSRYVRELRAGQHLGRHAACRDAAWLREIDDEDMYLRFFKLSLLGSSGSFLDGIFAARPPTASFAPPRPPPSGDPASFAPEVEKGLRAIAPGFFAVRDGEAGSNMYAFGKTVTGGGGIQFGNPHFPWYGGERLYQVHLTVPGKLEVQGSTLYGVPFVLIGFNETFAWSHTVSTGYRFTPYALTLKDGDPFTYVKDGEEKKITAVDLEIEVKEESGTLRKQNVRLYRSEYGPMIYLGNSVFDWTSERAFTIRDANAENFRLIRNYARINMAKSLDELERIQVEEVATPWVNTTAADRDGNVYYSDLTVVPNVPDEMAAACEVPILSRALAASAPGLPLLDGSKASCDWRTDEDSVQPGAFGPSKLPHVRRDDWVVNCNDSFWLTNATAPITGFARIIGREGYEQTLRSRLCHQQVEDRLDGTDGLAAAGTVTADLVRGIVLGSRVYSAERFKAAALPDLCATSTISLTYDVLTRSAVSPAVDVDVADACAALSNWDDRNNTDSRGSLVWDEFWFRVEALRSGNAAIVVYDVPFDANDPLNTPRDLTSSRPEVIQAFAAAVQAVKQSGFAVDAPRSSFSFREGKGGLSDRIPVPGGFQRTGNFTIAQRRSAVLTPDVGYSPLSYGNSYLHVVSYVGGTFDAMTCVTYSQSTDPASDHFDDLTRLYGNKQWLKAQWTEAEIAADTKSTADLAQ